MCIKKVFVRSYPCVVHVTCLATLLMCIISSEPALRDERAGRHAFANEVKMKS